MKKQYISPNTVMEIIPVVQSFLSGSGFDNGNDPDDNVGGDDGKKPGEGGDGYFGSARRRGSGASYVERNGGWSRGGLW